MKHILCAMLGMFLGMFLLTFGPLGELWSAIFPRLVGMAGRDLSHLYPVYIGIILLAGLIVGATVVICDEMKSLRKDLGLRDKSDDVRTEDK